MTEKEKAYFREYYKKHREHLCQYQRDRRAAWTDEQKEEAREQARELARQKRANMGPEELAARRQYYRDYYAQMTPEQKEKRRAYDRKYYAEHKARK